MTNQPNQPTRRQGLAATADLIDRIHRAVPALKKLPPAEPDAAGFLRRLVRQSRTCPKAAAMLAKFKHRADACGVPLQEFIKAEMREVMAEIHELRRG